MHIESSERSDERSHAALLVRMQLLWDEAEEIWDRYQHIDEYRGFVAADYGQVFQMLEQLQNRVSTVLEWGSGLGVITIMASNLGFEAYGMETESLLVDQSRDLALRYGPGATFANGSFIPDDYQWDPEYGEENLRTEVDARDGYGELDMELRDFDLVYAYPWPEEQSLFRDIMRRYGRTDALLLTYDAREGLSLSRVGDWG